MHQRLEATKAGFHPLTFQAYSGLSRASEFIDFIYQCQLHGKKIYNNILQGLDNLIEYFENLV